MAQMGFTRGARASAILGPGKASIAKDEALAPQPTAARLVES